MINDFLFSTENNETLTAYLDAIKKTQPLTTEEEHELGRRSQMGDIDARNKLVEANQRFVVDCVIKFHNKNVPSEELISAGNLGLVIAATRYNPAFEGRFTSYAVHYIRERIRQAIAEYNATIRIPLEVQKESRREAPSVNDELDFEKLLDWKTKTVHNPIYQSLDGSIDEESDDSRPLVEMVAAAADTDALAYALRESETDFGTFLSDYFSPSEVKVLMDYAHKLLDGYTVADLAHEYRLPKKRMRQYVAQLIEKANLLKLRERYQKLAA